MTETVLFVGGSTDGEKPDKETDDFYFPCHKCGIGRFLIRGLCSECGPLLHSVFNKQMDAYSKAAIEFEAETGKTPLSAWCEYEDWCSARQLNPPLD